MFIAGNKIYSTAQKYGLHMEREKKCFFFKEQKAKLELQKKKK